MQSEQDRAGSSRALPRRVQLSRKKGWRMPENTVSVARPGKWGNPFVVGAVTHVWHKSAAWPFEMYRDCFTVIANWHAVNLFRSAMEAKPDWFHESWVAPDLAELRGKNLACWCPLCDAHKDGKPIGVECLDCSPCHSDVLGELANPANGCGGNHA